MIDPLTIAYIVIIALLVACSAFFSMSETAFTSASQVRLKKMAMDGDKRAERAVMILEDYDKFLTTILVGNNLVNIAATSIATMMFAILLGQELGSVASTVVMTLVVLICGEITPKTLAKRHPERYVLKIVSAVHAIEIIFTPLSWLFGKLTSAIGNRVGG
ncbi:CNNM domain-containing protein [Candidatus Methanoprimaticola sp. MG2]|uniref:CNNM domain-containing protein n=1 Tax=Candidatus Methanoprimaticola sp. MG2 TaxID=3228838 RepID=UPI0039C6ADF5